MPTGLARGRRNATSCPPHHPGVRVYVSVYNVVSTMLSSVSCCRPDALGRRARRRAHPSCAIRARPPGAATAPTHRPRRQRPVGARSPPSRRAVRGPGSGVVRWGRGSPLHA